MTRIAVCLTTLAASLCLQACSEPETPREPDEWDKAFDIIRAENERSIPAVTYPKCDKVWKGEKLSDCGKKRLEVALDACASKVTVGVRLDPLSAGDSWIGRAGRQSMESVDERAERLRRDGLKIEEISYALANGTRLIKVIRCHLNPEMELTHTYSELAR
jgi:hypothetical protein